MTTRPIRRLLVANRGEIALRVLRTAQEMGIETIAVYSEADRNSLHVRRADRALCIGPPPPSESYLHRARILEAARGSGADAIHPGYGFLAENAEFAAECGEAGIEFLGPSPEAIRLMGDKVAARRAAQEAGVPVVPGLQENVSEQLLKEKAAEIGYPVMLKAAAGGGGKGIRIVHEEKGLQQAFELARAEARGAFGDDRIYLEKLVARPRHVEIQVMADKHGNVAHYGERECSVQRRHQKLLEESPSPALTPELRDQMGEAACKLAAAVDYVGAGTVEFLFSEGRFYFLEMNTRLQVEHPVTEMRYGVDFVREQIRVGNGLELAPVGEPRGHAIEVRVNAEDPDTFFPSLGRVVRMHLPGGPGVRMDSALYRGMEVTSHYDSMVAKLVVHGADRDAAIARAIRALRELRIVGITTSTSIAMRTLESAEFGGGDYDTGILERIERAVAPELRELACLAAAAARYLRAEELTATKADRPEKIPVWSLIGRMDRLRRPRA